MRFLCRQPLGAWRLAGLLIPSVGIGLVPVVGLAWLAPHYAQAVLHYAAFAALGLPLLLASSFTGRGRAVAVALTALGLFGFYLAYCFVPLSAVAAVALAATLTRFTVRECLRQIVHVERPVYAKLTAPNVIATLMRRDLRCLFRCHGKNLVGLGLTSALSALMTLAFRINGEQQGHELLLSAALFLTIALYGLYEILEALKASLGKELARRRWPITAGQRAWSLLGLLAVLAGPAAVLIALAGSRMGVAGSIVYVVFALVHISVTGALFSMRLLARESANGFYLLLVTGHVIVLLALSPGWYLALGLVWLPLGFRLMTRGLERFTSTTERISIERLA
jgi:hypothetical protein